MTVSVMTAHAAGWRHTDGWRVGNTSEDLKSNLGDFAHSTVKVCISGNASGTAAYSLINNIHSLNILQFGRDASGTAESGAGDFTSRVRRLHSLAMF